MEIESELNINSGNSTDFDSIKCGENESVSLQEAAELCQFNFGRLGNNFVQDCYIENCVGLKKYAYSNTILYIWTFCSALIFITGVFGNTVTIFAMGGHRAIKKTSTNRYLLNLGKCDSKKIAFCNFFNLIYLISFYFDTCCMYKS